MKKTLIMVLLFVLVITTSCSNKQSEQVTETSTDVEGDRFLPVYFVEAESIQELKDYVEKVWESETDNSVDVSILKIAEEVYSEELPPNAYTYGRKWERDGKDGIEVNNNEFLHIDWFEEDGKTWQFQFTVEYLEDGGTAGYTEGYSKVDSSNLYSQERSDRVLYAYIVNDNFYCTFSINKSAKEYDMLLTTFIDNCKTAESIING